MQLHLSKPLPDSAHNLMQRAGYHDFVDPNTGAQSYIRRIAHDFYPRYHAYLDDRTGELIVNLHVDQKKASYASGHAHGGEYEGPLVEREATRIREWFDSIKGGGGPFNQEPEKKGFWGSLFGDSTT